MRRLPQSDLYLKPALLATATRSLGRKPNPADLDEAVLRRIIRFSDMGAFTSLGDYLSALGNLRWSISPMKACCPTGAVRALGTARHAVDGAGGPQSRNPRRGAGPFEAANEHFAQSVEMARRMGARPGSRDRARMGRMAARRNGAVPKAALALLDEAQTIARELGLKRLETLLAQCSGHGPSQTAGDEQHAGRRRPAGAFVFPAFTRTVRCGSASVGMPLSVCATAAACRCWRAWSRLPAARSTCST